MQQDSSEPPYGSWQRLWNRLRAWVNPDYASLVDSELRYRDLLDNVADGVYETALDGRILAANQALVRMLGFESEAELRAAATARQFYVDPEQRTRILKQLEETGSIRNYELELIRRDGVRITVLENSRAVRDQAGTLRCYQGTLTDITDRKTLEVELLSARDRALDGSKLKSQFLANVSHELRTPLNAVVAMAELLVETPLNRQQREYAELIASSGDFLMEIIDKLLDFSRIEAGHLDLEKGYFRLRDVVEEAASMLADRASAKGIELICDVSPDLPEVVCGDAARLRQVLTNLIANAVKFTEEGEVLVSARPSPGNANSVGFEVRDSGIGIPEEARRTIFQPFRQVDGSSTRRYGGAGLGLTIAQQIVERMGGSINFESLDPGGTRFWFEARLDPAPGCRPGAASLSPALSGCRAELMIPNQACRAVITAWLARWGVTLVTGRDNAPGPPNFVIADMLAAQNLPTASVPLVLLTPVHGSKQPELGRTAMATAVSKPVRELALLEALLRAVGPRAADSAAPLRPLAEQLAEPVRPARILAAEDNRINQLVIRKLVERLGYEVDVVDNGRQLIHAVAQHRYDLILMDCQMPEMDGFEATATIRAMAPPTCTIPIVAVTAHAIQGDREQCIAAGMDDYISKPINLDALSATLERWTTRPSARRGTLTEWQSSSYPAVD